MKILKKIFFFFFFVFFLRLGFFFQIGKKSHLNPIGKGAEFRPLRTPKKIPVIPVSSAPCERGFSQQNILKSKLRNRLNPDRHNRLLMIRLNGPDEDMDFNSAARAFGSMKDRQK